MIDLTIEPAGLGHAVSRARERGIVIPTLAQMRDPGVIPEDIVRRLGSAVPSRIGPRSETIARPKVASGHPSWTPRRIAPAMRNTQASTWAWPSFREGPPTQLPSQHVQ